MHTETAKLFALISLLSGMILALSFSTAESVPQEHHGGTLGCKRCHLTHGRRQEVEPGVFNLFSIRGTITTPNSGEKDVIFTEMTGPNSYADGDDVYDGICEVCHTQTRHFKNGGAAPDQKHNNLGGGGKDGTHCISCHTHENGFAHAPGAGGVACDSCHGQDGGAGTGTSHSTHMESDSDDLKGPNIACSDCHDTAMYPCFKSGTDGNGDGLYDLSETDVCDHCHSQGGTYDGVTMAKTNWDEGIYELDGITLKAGKEEWCATCHDEEPANSKGDDSGIDAPNVIGDEIIETINGEIKGLIGFSVIVKGHIIEENQIMVFEINSLPVGRPPHPPSPHDYNEGFVGGNGLRP